MRHETEAVDFSTNIIKYLYEKFVLCTTDKMYYLLTMSGYLSDILITSC